MAEEESIRILIVDDDAEDAVILCRYLANIDKYTTETEYVESLDTALGQLRDKHFDLVLLDNRLSSGVTAREVLGEFKEQNIGVPVVIITGQGDQRIAVDLMKMGAYDYITKNDLTAEILEKTVHNTIEHHTLITRQKQAEEEIRQQKELLTDITSNIPHFVFWKDRNSVYLGCNENFARVAGVGSPENILGNTDYDLPWKKEEADYFVKCDKEVMEKGQPLLNSEESQLQADGKEATLLTSKVPLKDAEGNVIGILGIYADITERKQMEDNLRDAKERAEKAHEETGQANKRLEETYKKLIKTSHQAGMAEVATDVLHNVGNILNSVNVSASLIIEKIMNSELPNFKQLVDMIEEHSDDVGAFLTNDSKGKHIPVYLAELSKCLTNERSEIIEKARTLIKNVDHIKEIVNMQQSYARACGVEVTAVLDEIIEDAIQINRAGLERNDISIIREYDDIGQLIIDRQRVLQILVNLIGNAKYALIKSEKNGKSITVRFYKQGNDRIRIDVIDNGIGIAKEHLMKIFQHGFTTKKHGHGFGLHSGAIAAKEMDGSLTAQSDGIDHGTMFALELPFKPAGSTQTMNEKQLKSSD